MSGQSKDLSVDKFPPVEYGCFVAERVVESVSQSLRRAIAESGQTLMEIEAKTGVDPGRLSRFIRGERTLTLTALDALAKHFGLNLVHKGKRHGR
jgi:hypothetical protein